MTTHFLICSINSYVTICMSRIYHMKPAKLLSTKAVSQKIVMSENWGHESMVLKVLNLKQAFQSRTQGVRFNSEREGVWRISQWAVTVTFKKNWFFFKPSFLEFLYGPLCTPWLAKQQPTLSNTQWSWFKCFIWDANWYWI